LSARTPVTTWLAEVKGKDGPKPSQLRHVCLTIADDIRGDGSDGAFPSLRRIADKMGVAHTSVSRWVKQLAAAGWLEIVERPRQFRRVSWHYFLTLPVLERHNAPISPDIGAPKRTNTNSLGAQVTRIGASSSRIGASASRIGAPGWNGSLTDLSLKEGAPSPSPPEAAGSAAPELGTMTDEWLRLEASGMRKLGWSDARILAKYGRFGMTTAHLAELGK
jgi:hypothetical protein